MTGAAKKILLIGYGNPVREDDGLGPALAADIEKRALPGVTVESNYQLSVEDAEALTHADAVIFADAAVEGPEPYCFRRIQPKEDLSFSTHSVTPDSLLGLARSLFDSQTPGYMLGIRGYSFAMFTEQMTDQAAANLRAAIEFLVPVLVSGQLDAQVGEETDGNTKHG
ncbi:MAG: hydrogenase maturation protease [Candidatus Lernaella stagnicola]|nr:hydrogenase maturation protease [Candidatus Lernaella stagnicola]